jgi:hypothetical protein
MGMDLRVIQVTRIEQISNYFIHDCKPWNNLGITVL